MKDALPNANAIATFGKRDHKGEYFSAGAVHAINWASLYDEFAQIADASMLLERLV